ncbi:MAG: hypothetical protein K9J79_04115 [Desulfobacteraceae bacterium]|nr:hypothetical protein [Desulfobacteraceae bacterium]
MLNTAYQLASQEPDTEVILVTKDVNLRMKAKAVGLMAQDYTCRTRKRSAVVIIWGKLL